MQADCETSRERQRTLGSLSRNVGLNIARQMVGGLAAVALSALLARCLGPEGNGQYQCAVLLSATLVMLGNLGVPAGTTYFVSRGDFAVSDIVRANVGIGLGLGGLLMLGAWSALQLETIHAFFPVPDSLLATSLVSVPALLTGSSLAAVFQGLQDFRRYNLVNVLPQVATLAAAGLFVGAVDGGPTWAVRSYALGSGVGLAFAVGFLWRHVWHAGSRTGAYLLACLSFGWKAFAGDLVAYLNYRADMLLVAALLGPLELGFYSAAVIVAERTWILSQAVSMVIFPAAAGVRWHTTALAMTTARAARAVMAFGLAVGAALAILSQPVIGLLFGAQFRPAALPLALMLPGTVAWGVARVLCADIAGRGRPGLNLALTTGAAVVNLGLNFILIPRLGISGAAIATTASYSALFLAALVVYSQVSGLKVVDVIKPRADDVVAAVSTLRQLIRQKGAA